MISCECEGGGNIFKRMFFIVAGIVRVTAKMWAKRENYAMGGKKSKHTAQS